MTAHSVENYRYRCLYKAHFKREGREREGEGERERERERKREREGERERETMHSVVTLNAHFSLPVEPQKTTDWRDIYLMCVCVRAYFQYIDTNLCTIMDHRPIW